MFIHFLSIVKLHKNYGKNLYKLHKQFFYVKICQIPINYKLRSSTRNRMWTTGSKENTPRWFEVCLRVRPPLPVFTGGTVFHEPFQGVIRSYCALVGFGYFPLPCLSLCAFSIAQIQLAVKGFLKKIFGSSCRPPSRASGLRT